MTVITIGNAAITRASIGYAGTTYVDEFAPADGTGTIDTIKAFMYIATTATAQVGIFYRTTGTSLSTRSVADLGPLAIGLNTITGLSLAVETGDFIGIYHATNGNIRRSDIYGASQSKAGDQIPSNNVDFGAAGTMILSLQGTGTTPSNSPFPTYLPEELDTEGAC